jgi:DNA helicase-2/ATP-dependent DNA helicase PcrA
MGRKTDLEQLILDSYRLIREHQQIIQVSDRPEEKLRSTRQIEHQWALAKGYLTEYVDLWQLRPWQVPDGVFEIVARFPELAGMLNAPVVSDLPVNQLASQAHITDQFGLRDTTSEGEAEGWSEGLPDDQQTVVTYVGSHARLLAGPGTGKTFCLTRRIEYLISERGVNPEEIVALTFTRAAAAELRERVQERLGLEKDKGPRITTLHSFALRQLLRNSELTSLPQPLRIADDYEERHVIQEELKGLVGTNLRGIKRLLNRLSADWQTLDADQDRWKERFPNPRFLGAWREHQTIYGYTLRAELVYQLKRTLEQRGDFRLESPLPHLLVDEYQDLNRCDLAVIRAFAARGAELYVAGDDDQSIYGFRYAHPEGIRRFNRDYGGSVSLTLERCRRCAAPILDIARFVAELDPRRVPKTIFPAYDDQIGLVRIFRFGNQGEEAEGIARLCQWLITTQGRPADEVLILMRLDTDQKLSSVIRAYLKHYGIPAQTVVDPLSPLDEPAGRELLCALRLLVNPEDHLAWRVWLKIRKNRIGDGILKSAYDLAHQERITYTAILRRIYDGPTRLPRVGQRLANAIDDLLGILNRLEGVAADGWEAQVLVAAQTLIPDDEKRESILSLLWTVRDEMEADSLEKLLRVLQVSLGAKEQEAAEDEVRLMTMHQAKGLTARAVIIAGAEDEFIPGRSDGTPLEDDERRLLYVSLTRAQQFLFITHCDRRSDEQRWMGRKPGTAVRNLTRFLTDGPVPSKDGRAFWENL